MSKTGAAKGPSREELLTTQFYEWEIRGRGWQVWDTAVEIEPPFRPFLYHSVPRSASVDDARKPTLLSSLFEQLFKPAAPEPVESQVPEPEPAPDLDDSDMVELRIAVPSTLKISTDISELFLFSLDICNGPIAFEIIADAESVGVQLACRQPDAAIIKDQFSAYFPEAVFRERTASLPQIVDSRDPMKLAFVDLGLSNEFMLPIAVSGSAQVDPLISVIGALANLKDQETGLIQVLFAPVRSPWATSIIRAVSDDAGNAFFADAPEILKLAREKVSRLLYSVVIRVLAQSQTVEQAAHIVRTVAGTLTQLSNPIGNAFIALSDEGYSSEDHLEDILFRRSHRSGMILNSGELASLVHLPSVSVRSAKLERAGDRTKVAPKMAGSASLVLGYNCHAGTTTTVSLTPNQRVRHTYVLGASGTGKSTFLLNCILQDIGNGEGIGVLDPHGDLIDRILESIPEERYADVILLDPSDEEYPVGFNILSAHSELEKNVLSSDLVSVFRRLSTSWGDQMTSVLGNALLAFLESDRGGTLLDLRRFLVEREFRSSFLETVNDSEVVYYWQKEFPLLSGKPQAPLLTRLDSFLRPKIIRRIVGQRENMLDFRSIMDGNKIFLAKLSQGAIGEENAYLFGTLLVSKIHQTVIGRQDVKESARTPFYVYIDEFQNFITPSMTSILAGARKYGLGLILAHQDLRQLWDEDTQLASAVIANAYTRVCFRLGEFDAKKLEDGFSFFTSADLQNLGVGEAISRIERSEYDFNLKTLPLPEVPEDVAATRREKVIAQSRVRYGTKRQDVDGVLEQAGQVLPTPSPTEAITKRAVELVLSTRVDPAPKARREVKPVVATPSMPGRGGAQHKYLQQLVKRMAEAHGYRATIEKEILGGGGKIDVALDRGDERIACEISVTTTYEHEFGNVQKCIASGYMSVIVISTDKKALTHLQDFISSRLEQKYEQCVAFLLPEELIPHFAQKQTVTTVADKTVRGYRVKVSYKAVGDQERNAKEQAVANVIVQAMRRLKAEP